MANGHRGIEKLQHVVCFGVECLGDVLIRLTITAGRGDRVGGDPAGLNSSLPARQGSLCVSVRGSQPDLRTPCYASDRARCACACGGEGTMMQTHALMCPHLHYNQCPAGTRTQPATQYYF